MGWGELRRWGGDAVRIAPLAGGVANDVWSVRVNGQLAVARLGQRSDADLAWETELMLHLNRSGMTVPAPIPTTDGALFTQGLVVMTYIEGAPPRTEGDWQRVADTLRRLHRLTAGWSQRPGWVCSTDLLEVETGTRIDLSAMRGAVPPGRGWSAGPSRSFMEIPIRVISASLQTGFLDRLGRSPCRRVGPRS